MNRVSNIFLAALLLTFSLFAQMDEVILPELNVSVEQESREMRKLAASRKIVINQKDFENLGDITAGDVIKRYPGLWVQGPVSSNRNVLLCGLDKVFQSVMIDGNRPAGGEADREFKLDRIPLDAVDKIEIINIPTVDYCSDAVAGVVNLVTKKSEFEKKLLFDVSPSANSTNDYKAGNGEIYASFKQNDLFFSGSYNTEARINTEELSDPVSGISGDVEEDCDIRTTTLSAGSEFGISDATKLKFYGLYSNFDEVRDVTQDVKMRSQGGLNYRDIITDQSMLRRLMTFDTGITHAIGEYSDISFRTLVSRSDDEKDKHANEEKSDGYALTDEVEDQLNYEFMFSSDYKNLDTKLLSFPNTVKTGLKADYLLRDYDRFVSTVEYTSADTLNSNEDGSFEYGEIQSGAYLIDEVYVKPVIYSIGLRIEHSYYDYLINATSEKGNNSYYFINPSLLLNWRLRDEYIVKAGFSRQIARPAFAAVVPIDKIKTKKNQIERGNPDLEPADALTYNLGVEYYHKKDFLSLYGYFKDVNNIIEIENIGTDDATGYTIYQYVNISTALVFGADFEFAFDLAEIGMKGFSVNGNYSWLGSQIEDRNTGLMRRINEQPMNIINANLNYKNGPFKLTAGGNFSDEKIIWSTIVDGVLVERTVTDAFLQFDASVKYSFSEDVMLYFNANNIFGEEVRVTQGSVTDVEAVGTTYTLGVKYGIRGK
ncbi:MAG TPA: TonB-dependent receptor [Clostridiales bacterium]|nr:TonB-dependent receptor [Clostridiales bacterium]